MKLSPFDNSFQLFNSLVNDLMPVSDEAVRPPLTISDHEDRFVIECDLPGVALDEITLEVHDGILEISGERKRPEVPEGSTVRFNERVWSSFRRRIRLDKSVDPTAITADYDNGVLVVTAPRRAETMPKKITIRKAAAE